MNLYFTQTEVLGREGWSIALIKKLNLKPNEQVGSYKLYSKEVILNLEKEETFKEWKRKHKLKSLITHKAISDSKKKLLEKVKTSEIIVAKVHDLEQHAIDHYLEINHTSKRPTRRATIEKITVNYIRHKLSNYADGLNMIRNRWGSKEAYLLLNHRIYTEIIQVYGTYKQECLRQMHEKALKTIG